jgi:SAM-dependent methyltransferase
MTSHDLARSAAHWLATPLGQHLLAQEQEHFDKAIADVFGYNALQLGLPGVDFLRASRISLRLHVDPDASAELRADFRDLPIASNSTDLVVLPHALEFSADPHQILREAARILMPEAQLAVACFNPWSLWGLRRLFGSRSAYPWNGRFINLHRLKDWCALLGLEIIGGHMGCYVPPCGTTRWLGRLGFMEEAGDRWWPIAGGVYYLQAVKRVRGMRLIMPKWREKLAADKMLAPAPKKVSSQEEALTAREAVTGDS